MHTGGGGARRRTTRSRRPWPGPPRPALSLPRPKVTSGASVSRQLPPAGSVARTRSARARRRLAFPARGSSVPVPPKVDERARGARGGTERGGMERGCWAPRTLVLAVLLLLATLRTRAATGYYPRFSPFFFLCTHHGELEGDGEQGEVLISLHIAGNPTYYVPGQEYHGRYHGIPMAPRWLASASFHPFPSSQGPASRRPGQPPTSVGCAAWGENKVSGEWSPELGFQLSPNTFRDKLVLK